MAMVRHIRELLRHLRHPDSYQARLERERQIFAVQECVHDLPPIFHYWSNTYLRPMFEAHGFAHPDAFFDLHLAQAYDAGRAAGEDRVRFLSLGSGNCDAELRMAQALVASGRDRFRFECLDLNPAMLERGRSAAAAVGLTEWLLPVEGDFNRWWPAERYQAVVANQSLHHVMDLEHLFSAIAEAIGDGGVLITSDMIGRNGHQRWPEALEILEEYWQELPQRYRWNVQLGRQEDRFQNWDCSVEGFEGIRAQDILPLLVERFGFRLFLPYANLVSPFIDRSFGPHFDAEADWDRGLIDRIHARDEAEFQSGRLKPTQMVAVLCNDRGAVPAIRDGLMPEFCIRQPG